MSKRSYLLKKLLAFVDAELELVRFRIKYPSQFHIQSNKVPPSPLYLTDETYRELLEKDVVFGTVLRYERTVRYLEEFMKEKYRFSDIPLKNINHEFMKEFEHFINTEKDCAQNATVKYLKNLKKIIWNALVNKWMDDNPMNFTIELYIRSR